MTGVKCAVFVIVAALGFVARSADAAGGCEVGDFEDCSARCSKHEDESCGVLGIMLAAGRGVGKDVDKGRQLLESACAARSARACVDLASLSENALGVPKDEAKARTVYERSCQKDRFTYGCIRLGGIYETGHGVTADLAKAAELYEHACDAGDLRGCTQLGRLAETGKGVTKDLARAKQLYQTACDHAEPAGCAFLASQFDRTDQPRAMALYQVACDHHYWLACTRLGYLYASGPSFGPIDLEHGVPLYERACDHNELDACNNLGLIYAGGNGIAQDAAKAKALYQRACDGGNASGCQNLGAPIVASPSSPAAPEAKDESACDQLAGAAAGACYNTVGLAYDKGWTANKKRRTGLPQDHARAAQLFRKACDLGESSGCINFASSLYLGTGLPRDVPQGLKLLHRICYTDKLAAACDYLKQQPAWVQDRKLVKALPAWAKDGPIDPVEGGDSKITGPGCEGFWNEKHQDSPAVARLKGGADLALARLKEARRPASVPVEVWSGCASLWEHYIRANRAQMDREAREAEAADQEQPDDAPDTTSSPSRPTRDPAAAARKSCLDRCFKEYSKCHQPRTGPSICQPAKQRCEKDC